MIKKLPSAPTLKEVESFALSEIKDAAADRGHPCRNVVLSTMGADGPANRILVLRKATTNPFTVELHTDLRSHKVTELERDPRASMLLWNHETKCQFRLKGEAKILRTGSDISRAWNDTPAPARFSYNTALAPCSELMGATWRPVTQRETTDAAHFGIIRCTVAELEVLMLRSEGHLRARFGYSVNGGEIASFLVP